MDRSPGFIEALKTIAVRLLDQDSKRLDIGKVCVILNQRLNAVLALITDLRASGSELKKVDLPGLGSFSRLLCKIQRN